MPIGSNNCKRGYLLYYMLPRGFCTLVHSFILQFSLVAVYEICYLTIIILFVIINF